MKPAEIETLKEKLEKEFEATVTVEKLESGRGRYRLAVISGLFEKMSHLSRQDKVWEVVDKAVAASELPRETSLDVSLILAYAPSELKQPA
jgi:hypothetical protein